MPGIHADEQPLADRVPQFSMGHRVKPGGEEDYVGLRPRCTASGKSGSARPLPQFYAFAI